MTSIHPQVCSVDGLFCFIIDDEQQFSSPEPIITVRRLRAIAGIPDGTPVVKVNQDGTQEQLRDDDKVELEKCRHFKKLPRFVRGFDRVRAELDQVRSVHGDVELVDIGLLVRSFRLPDLFVQDRVPILVPLTPAYPSAPPDNFLVPWGTALRSGQPLQNYSGPVPAAGGQWGQFSHHIEGGAWRPAIDNILTYLLTVQGRLLQGA